MTAGQICDIVRYEMRKKGSARKGKTMLTVIFGSYLYNEHVNSLRKYELCLIDAPCQDNKSRMNCVRI